MIRITKVKADEIGRRPLDGGTFVNEPYPEDGFLIEQDGAKSVYVRKSTLKEFFENGLLQWQEKDEWRNKVVHWGGEVFP